MVVMGGRPVPGEEAPQAKLGLALSGGGFRAAFFHVGVLARLAETGVLAKVEVISTVSGGSIVGALYYLLLRQELEAKRDGEIGTAGYVKIVQDLETTLLAAVQRNIRSRVFANLLSNLRMAKRSYSRSDRIGELYDLHLYRGAWGEGRETPIRLRELLIHPEGRESFDPKWRNPDRTEKVPILLLNATTLNSGHNWRFEAIRMGETLPEDELDAAATRRVDKNLWLRPGYFHPQPGRADQPPVPDRHMDFPLGAAVAASAAVPGVFRPLSITEMYEDVRVQLVDGGVQDNQGIQGLRDRKCKRMIVSDASGQMDDANRPKPWLPWVLLRSSSIAQDRIRDRQLIASLRRENLTLVDLRKGLAGDAALPEEPPRPGDPPPEGGSAGFGVHPKVQRALSEIRTDLDFFSRLEAHSLSLSGYRMSDPELAGGPIVVLAKPVSAAGRPSWGFASVADRIAGTDRSYLRKLRAGRRRFLRQLPYLSLKPILLLGAGIAVMAIALLIAPRTVAIVAAVAALTALLTPFAFFAWAHASLLLARLYEK